MAEFNIREFERHFDSRRRRRKIRKALSVAFIGLVLCALTVGFVLFAEYVQHH
jgi:hypothetical protein